MEQQRTNKITEVGQECKHCHTPVVKRQHERPRKKRNKGGYYFEWWLACPNKHCHAIYHVEAAKRFYQDSATLDLGGIEIFTRTEVTYGE